MFITLASIKLCFYCYCSFAFIAMATPLTYNGKNETCHSLLSLSDILTKGFTEFLCSWSSPLLTLLILSKLLNMIGCHGNRKAKFAKKNWKIINSEAIREMKLKLRRNVHNITLIKFHFLLSLFMCFRCQGKLKFPLTCNVKNETWQWLLSHCRYFDKSFSEMFI